ncbi:MAG: succinate dehydrogenase, cytochrome b556 subunit [Acidimicrobiales bacterium]
MSTTAGTPTKAPGVYGKATVYRGKSGQWAFVLHRITGFLIFMFLLLHIVDVSLISYHHGTTYDAVHQLYGNILLRLFEVGLLFGLVFHSLNGLRIVMIDFFPGAVRNQRNLFSVVLGLTVLFTVIGGVIIVKPFFTGS